MKLLSIVILLLLLLLGSVMNEGTVCREQVFAVTGEAMAQQIGDLWQKVNPELHHWAAGKGYISDGFNRSHPSELYDIQLHTANLLRYATQSNNISIFESLLKLYSDVFQTLKETDQYLFYYYPDSPRQSIHSLDKSYRMWLNVNNFEMILSSSQFLYVVSEVLVFISRLDPSSRSTLMTDFATQAVSILKDHYLRWCFAEAGPFQVRGWGCKVDGMYVSGGLNHLEFLAKKRHGDLGDQTSPSYCNAVTDTDLWIVTGVANLLASFRSDADLVRMTRDDYRSYHEYLVAGLELVKQRLTFTDLQDFSLNKVHGVVFDSGSWNDSKDYRYLSYSSYLFPADFIQDQLLPPIETSWDISHSRRYVDVFISLVRDAEIIGLSFPKEPLLECFANQFIYKVFNGDFRYPLFNNFWNGDNGWYRVGYSKRQGYGYAPNDLSVASLTGGYAWFAPYNKDVGTLYSKLYTMIACDLKQDNQWLIDHFSGNRYKEYNRFKLQLFTDQTSMSKNLLLIDFLPTLLDSKIVPTF